jgi:hypothetical protein
MNKMIEGLLAYSRVSTKAQLPQDIELNEVICLIQELEMSVAIEEKQALIHIPNILPHISRRRFTSTPAYAAPAGQRVKI